MQENKLNIGMSKENVISLLGQPKKESQLEDYLILRYKSNTERYADYFYFIDDNLVLESNSVYKDDLIIKDFIDKYGKPNFSFLKNNSTLINNNEVIHIWIRDGREIISSENEYTSKVIRERLFKPISFNEYSLTWGKNYDVSQSVKISGLEINLKEITIDSRIITTQKTLPPKVQTNSFSSFKKYIPLPLFLIVFTSLLIFLIFKIKNKRKKRPEEVILDDQL